MFQSESYTSGGPNPIVGSDLLFSDNTLRLVEVDEGSSTYRVYLGKAIEPYNAMPCNRVLLWSHDEKIFQTVILRNGIKLAMNDDCRMKDMNVVGGGRLVWLGEGHRFAVLNPPRGHFNPSPTIHTNAMAMVEFSNCLCHG